MNCLSFDVGGTTVKYGVIDESYKILKKDKIPTPENENDFIYSLSNIIQENHSIKLAFLPFATNKGLKLCFDHTKTRIK